MYQENYDVKLNEISKKAKLLSHQVSELIDSEKQNDTVILIGEYHLQLAQSFFQIEFLKETKGLFDFSTSMEASEKEFFADWTPQKMQWGLHFSSALKRVHRNNFCYMGACLTASYILNDLQTSFLCADIPCSEREEEMMDKLKERDDAMYQNISSYQSLPQNQKPLIHIGGGAHLADSSHPGRLTLLDRLLETKKVIAINLIEDTDWNYQMKFQNEKIVSLGSAQKENLIADINIKLPYTEVCGDNRLFKIWDKIVLANDAPEFLLSQRNRNMHKKLQF